MLALKADNDIFMNLSFKMQCENYFNVGGVKWMETRVLEGESIDAALKRFRRQCQRDGILSEWKKREHYEKPSVKRKKKSEAARRRRSS